MKKSKTSSVATTDVSPHDAAERRVADIAELFSEMHAWVKACCAETGPAGKAEGQKILSKLGELQTVHVLLLRAEETFHDKFSADTRASETDYDAIRADIGRRLDRIRAAQASGGVSGDADPA